MYSPLQVGIDLTDHQQLGIFLMFCVKNSLLLCFYLKLFILLFLVRAESSLLCRLFFQLWRAGPTLQLWGCVSHSSGFPCCRAVVFSEMRGLQQLQHMGSTGCGSGSPAVEPRLNSCGTGALLLWSMWGLPRDRTHVSYPGKDVNWQGECLLHSPPLSLQGSPIYLFFFNWKIIALQRCLGFCHTTT